MASDGIHIGQWFPHSNDELFAFFSDLRNLEVISPPWLGLRLVGVPNGKPGKGTLIDYAFHRFGVNMRWRARIAEWDPPHRFVDEQVHGPFQQWVHEHRFDPSEGGTWMSDRVTYVAPGGALSGLVSRLFVRREVASIFEYRRQRLAERFG